MLTMVRHAYHILVMSNREAVHIKLSGATYKNLAGQ